MRENQLPPSLATKQHKFRVSFTGWPIGFFSPGRCNESEVEEHNVVGDIVVLELAWELGVGLETALAGPEAARRGDAAWQRLFIANKIFISIYYLLIPIKT
jgi:hypothetical protein